MGRRQAVRQILYRVNAGGVTLTGDPNWEVDNLANPSPYFSTSSVNTAVTGTSGTIDMSHPSIPAGTPMAVFQTDRYDKAGLGEMGYDFPVTPGQHEVRLYFAETWSGGQAAGIRQFDVQIEGATVLNNYDIYADVGGFAGIVKSFTVFSDANLDIDFIHVVQNPAIRGIEILSTMPLASKADVTQAGALEFAPSQPPFLVSMCLSTAASWRPADFAATRPRAWRGLDSTANRSADVQPGRI